MNNNASTCVDESLVDREDTGVVRCTLIVIVKQKTESDEKNGS